MVSVVADYKFNIWEILVNVVLAKEKNVTIFSTNYCLLIRESRLFITRIFTKFTTAKIFFFQLIYFIF